jgi:hypothetical protein
VTESDRPVTAPRGTTLSTEQLAQVFRLLKGADGVELKLSVSDADRRSAVAALDIDALDAQVRQVAFLDTPDLVLDARGVVVRVRRVQRKSADSIIKLRPLDPSDVPKQVRTSAAFSIEVDAMPGGFVCSGTMKATLDDAEARAALRHARPLRRLFTKEQRDLFAAHAPAGVNLDELSVLGPINVLKLKFAPEGFSRRMVAELWFYPDGSRTLELSTKCLPTEAFETAAATRDFLAARGIDLTAEQQTKTRAALELFAAGLREAEPTTPDTEE